MPEHHHVQLGALAGHRIEEQQGAVRIAAQATRSSPRCRRAATRAPLRAVDDADDVSPRRRAASPSPLRRRTTGLDGEEACDRAVGIRRSSRLLPEQVDAVAWTPRRLGADHVRRRRSAANCRCRQPVAASFVSIRSTLCRRRPPGMSESSAPSRLGGRCRTTPARRRRRRPVAVITWSSLRAQPSIEIANARCVTGDLRIDGRRVTRGEVRAVKLLPGRCGGSRPAAEVWGSRSRRPRRPSAGASWAHTSSCSDERSRAYPRNSCFATSTGVWGRSRRRRASE